MRLRIRLQWKNGPPKGGMGRGAFGGSSLKERGGANERIKKNV